jgi:CelD/BcsL family acetyltransferase involved in cellulose biosynthesis
MAEWWERRGQRRQLFVLTVREPTGRLIAVAPLYVRRSGPPSIGPRRLGFLADELVGSDYLNILVEPPFEHGVAREIACFLLEHRDEWDYIELADVDRESIMIAALRGQLIGRGLTEHVATGFVCPFLSLPSSFDEYLGRLDVRMRQSVRRRRRLLESTAPVKFIALADGPAIESRFPELLRLHRLRFEQAATPSSFLDPAVQAFHRAVLKRLAGRGWVRLYLLEVRGEPVAALYGFSIMKKFAYYQSGNDPAWLPRFGVGGVMLGRTIEALIQSGHTEFDFLRGHEPHKLRWGGHIRQMLTISFFDHRVTSRWSLAARRWRDRVAWAKDTVRPWLKTAGIASPRDGQTGRQRL